MVIIQREKKLTNLIVRLFLIDFPAQINTLEFSFLSSLSIIMAELRPSGFPEYSPAQQLIFDQITEIITHNYKQFGYTHIHTPAVEKNTTLLAKNGEET